MTWHRLGTARDLSEGGMQSYRVAERDITVAQVQGELFAFDDTCTHAEVSLCSGMLEGHEVECCAHGARFDIRTGVATGLPATEPLQTYPLKREGEDLYVELDR